MREKRLTTMYAAAVAHPVRVRTLAIMAERISSPAAVARELRMGVNAVNYHVTALRKAELIEKVAERPVRGALEHFYRAVELPLIWDTTKLTKDDWQLFIENILSMFAANAAYAIDMGTLLVRPEFHVTRKMLDLDEEGWKEAAEVYKDTYHRIDEIEVKSEERMKGRKRKPIRALSFLSLFELPPADPLTIRNSGG